MGEYTEDIEFVLELIEETGQAVTFKSLVDGVPSDPAKPWKPSAGSSTDHPVKIAFLPRERENEKRVQYRKETDISMGLILGYMGQVNVVPKLKDIVIRGSKTYVVETIDTVEPNDEGVILYTFEFSIGSL